MALTEFTKDMGIIAKLDDEPNDVGGLTAAQLKEKFDEGGAALKQYINETLLPELAADTAAAALGATLGGTSMSVQNALDELQVAAVKSGNVPVGGNAGDILRKKSDELYDLEWVNPNWFTSFSFAAGDWVAGENGEYVITVPAAYHKRAGADFGCFLRHRVDGTLKSNTWAVLGTQSQYDEETGTITLTGADAYDGVAVFCGVGVVEGSGAVQGNEVVLLTGENDADTEIAADIEGETYSLENVSTDADTAADGTIIIKKVEE